jgi:hypothetical protein
MEERYFAASNSCRGFMGYFGEIFDPSKLEHVYIIKGGPGTGKNMFMRCIAKAAEKKKMKVVYYYCSSDQNSLDGIIIGGRIAVLDGTAPHTADASLPGAAEDIVDLGVFWRMEELSEKRDEIESLNAEKKKHYSMAYRYLAAYHEISESARVLTSPIIDREKLRKSVSSVFKGVKSGTKYRPSIAICDSVGMEGRVRFESLENKAKQIYSIADLFDTAHEYLSEAANEAMLKKKAVTLSYDPINSDRLDALYLEEEEILLTRSDVPNAKVISMSRFIPQRALAPYRSSLKNAMKLRELMLDETLSELAAVKKVHFEIEEIYKSAMDFPAKEKFTKDFLKKLSL